MIEISVKEARNQLSRLLDKVEYGDEIIITRRGKRVARMTPPEGNDKLPELKLFRKGLSISGESMSSAVLKNRAGERY